ncbi:MAG: hypothetical protein IJB89_08540 [Akkermansia sp.]|nr:hypothetical protein [Akkermansiaceae bacterium]MBQ3144547.1 hypothetical protein [Akkermansia sp.]
MEEILIDVGEFLVDAAFAAVVGVAAGIVAQFFISKYRETIYGWVASRLKGHPGVQRVALRALHSNYQAEQAIRVKIGNAVYVVTQMLGIKSGSQAVVMSDVKVDAPASVVTRELTPEELARYSSYALNVSASDTEETLLRKGLVPEKVARGMGIIDKKGKVKGLHEVCSQEKVQELLYA